MAYGIYAKPVGPGPATPAELFIDSNMTFPQSIGNYATGDIELRNTSATINVSQFDGQGTMFVIPTTEIVREVYVAPNLFPSIVGVKTLSISGKTVTFNLQSASYRNRYWNMSWNAYKIWPQGNQSYGITFSNSANYFAISDSGVVGQCIYAYKGNVSNGFKIPAIAGFDMTKVVVFGGWTDTTHTVTYDPTTQVINVYSNHSNFSGKNEGGTIANMKIVVFGNGAAVPVHNGGLNIYSPNGQTCVFSTYRTPFIVNKFMSSAGGATGLAAPMVCLMKSYGAIAETKGNFQWQHSRGVMMNGGTIGNGWGPLISTWTAQYGGIYNAIVNVPLPVLDSANYFA